MKRTITYKGIKEIVYTLTESDLNQAALISIQNGQFYVTSQKLSEYYYEWGDNEAGRVFLEITQKIIEKETGE